MSMLNEKAVRVYNSYLLSVTETAELLGITRTAVQNKIDEDELNAKKVGATYVVLIDPTQYNSFKTGKTKDSEGDEIKTTEVEVPVKKPIKDYRKKK